MDIKKILPQITSAVLVIILLISALLSSSVGVKTAPFSLMEKCGIYQSEGGFSYGVSDGSFSAGTSHEALISIMKMFAAENTISGLVPYIFLSLLLIFAAIWAVNSASKTSYKWTTFLCAVLIPFIYCDFSNLAYFKTLYPYPVIMILILLVCAMFAGFYKKGKIGYAGIILIFTAVVFMSRIGVIQAVVSLVLGIAIIRLYKIAVSKPAAVLAVVFGAVAILQSVIFIFNTNGVDYRQGLYNSVFYGVCRYDSVTELGLDQKLDDFKEVYYGMKENESDYDLENSFYGKISYKKIIAYYAKHPVNFAKLLNDEAKAAFFNDSDMPFTFYSTLKKFYVPTGLLWVLLISLIYILVALFTGKKHGNLKPVSEYIALLPIMWILSLAAAVVLNGNCDIYMTSYTFSIIFDTMVMFAAIGGIRIMLKNRDDKKAQYGITHE